MKSLIFFCRLAGYRCEQPFTGPGAAGFYGGWTRGAQDLSGSLGPRPNRMASLVSERAFLRARLPTAVSVYAGPGG